MQATFVTVAASATPTDTYSLSINGTAIYTADRDFDRRHDLGHCGQRECIGDGRHRDVRQRQQPHDAARPSTAATSLVSQTAGAAAGAGEGLAATTGVNNTVNDALDFSTGTGATRRPDCGRLDPPDGGRRDHVIGGNTPTNIGLALRLPGPRHDSR